MQIASMGHKYLALIQDPLTYQEVIKEILVEGNLQGIF